MSDQWRANVTTIAGQPVAVVELNIKRTFLIDAQMWQNVEKIIKGNGDNYEGLGAGNLVEIVSLIYNLPPEARPYFSVPWSEEASLHLAEMPLAQLMKLTERDAFFRVEGSAQAGFVGYMTIGGQDRKVDLSEANIPNVLAALDQTIADAEADRAAARITPDEEKIIKEFCESMRQPIAQCRDEMIKMREWQRQRDAKPDRPPSGAGGRGDWGGWRPEATHTGDFGRGFEGRMGNVA